MTRRRRIFFSLGVAAIVISLVAVGLDVMRGEQMIVTVASLANALTGWYVLARWGRQEPVH